MLKSNQTGKRPKGRAQKKGAAHDVFYRAAGGPCHHQISRPMLYCSVMRLRRLLSARMRAASVRAVACRNGVARAGASRVMRSNDVELILNTILFMFASTSAERGP